jgi:hypothetical protein
MIGYQQVNVKRRRAADRGRSAAELENAVDGESIRRVVGDLLGRLVAHDDRLQDVGGGAKQSLKLGPSEDGVVPGVEANRNG